jgi:hypothetical protein
MGLRLLCTVLTPTAKATDGTPARDHPAAADH